MFKTIIKNYKYCRMSNYAAGILLVSWNGNELCVLLGKDNYNTYSDYGGKSDYVDNGYPYLTASREMFEETLLKEMF